MEAISLSMVTLALFGMGSAATALLTSAFPLSVLVRGQEHGRYAGLSAVEATSQGPKRPIGGPGTPVARRVAPSFTAA